MDLHLRPDLLIQFFGVAQLVKALFPTNHLKLACVVVFSVRITALSFRILVGLLALLLLFFFIVLLSVLVLAILAWAARFLVLILLVFSLCRPFLSSIMIKK